MFFHPPHIPTICIHYYELGRTFSSQWVLFPKLWNQKISSERHWAYAHAMLRMEWPQPLIYEEFYSVITMHGLQLLPKEKEGDSYHGEGMFPSPSVIFSSSQPYHCAMVCMELSVPFKSPLIHSNTKTLF